MYMKNGFAKVLIGVGKGKKDYDKRDVLKKKKQNVIWIEHLKRAIDKRITITGRMSLLNFDYI